MKLRIARIVAAAMYTLGICSGQGTISTFYATGSTGLAIDAQGNVYLTLTSTDQVYKISSGRISTIAGNGTFQAYTGDGGQAINAGLNISGTIGGLDGIAVDSSGNVYFSDSGNNVIRKINTAGIISTYAGDGTGAGSFFGAFGGDNGPATKAQLNGPGDIAIDSNGNLYICDTSNSRVRKVTPGGIITTFAGDGNVVFEGDGVQASTTAVPTPTGIAVDSQGNVYITSDRRVRKVTAATGIITTIAGTGVNGYSGDGGPAVAAQLKAPIGIGVDQFGNVFFTDRNTGGHVRKVDAAGIITNYAGIEGNASTPLGDGGPATSGFFMAPNDLMVDSSGNVYISTNGLATGRIRKIAPSGAGFVSSPASLSFSYGIGGANPASQTLSITSTGGALAYTTSASSTGNWLSVSPGSGSTPGALTVSVNPAGLAGGQTYQGTILVTPTVPGNSPLSINVSLTVTGAGAPTITGQVVNATGYQAKLAPDTVFVIFGSNLGPAALVPATGPNYPANLSGTSVIFTPVGGGPAITARMVYTLASQVAGILPSSIAPGVYAVTVTNNTLTSAPRNVTVVARSFGIAAANSGGSGTAQATIANINGGISLTRFTAGTVSFGGNTWTLSPAHPGDTIVLWGTGGGADAQNDNGGSSGDQTAAGNFIVTAGTRQITPLYAGTSSGYPGLFQINFRLPADIAIDCFTPISVTASGEASNTVVIPIAAAGLTSCTDPSMPASVLSKLDSGGNITFGGLVITRFTEALSGITSETAIGVVFSYTPAEWTILHSGPTFGACRLYDRTYPQGGKDPGSPDSSLDAGTRLSLSGQNLPAGSGLSMTSTASGPVYSAPLSSGTLTNASYTISAPGGADVGPFSSSTVFPASFTATNFSGITSINRSQPLTFTWNGTGIDQVGIIVTSSLTAGGVVHVTTLNCTGIPAGPGSYTVPAAALAGLLPAAVTGNNFGNVSITGINTQGNFTANLIRGGQLDIGAFWSEIGIGKNIAVQ